MLKGKKKKRHIYLLITPQTFSLNQDFCNLLQKS